MGGGGTPADGKFTVGGTSDRLSTIIYIYKSMNR